MQDNKNTQNNTPAPWYFKYIFLTVIIIGFILLFWGIKSKVNSEKNGDASTAETNTEIPTITIEDLSKYEGCLIWKNEPYFLFDNMLIDKSLLDKKLGATNSSFNSNKDNTYDAIDGAVYEYLEGMDFYSIKENTSDIAVDCDNELGYLIFTKNIKEYKEKYEDNLDFKEEKNIKLYPNAIDEDFSNVIELQNNDFKDKKEIDYITDIDNYKIFLLTINDNNYLYSYMCLYDNPNKKAFIQNQVSKKTLEISLDLGDLYEDN